MRSFDLSFDSSGLRSLLRESGRLYIRYMGVGVSAVPAGIAYGICVAKGYDRWWLALLAITVSLCLARMMWKYLDSKLLPRPVFLGFTSGNFATMELESGASNFGLSNLAAFAESHSPSGPAVGAAEVQVMKEEAYAFAGN